MTVISESSQAAKASATIGLIGGLGMNAGVYYYRELERRCTSASIKLRLAMIHADINIVLDAVGRNDPETLAAYFFPLFSDLHKAGASVGAIPAVAPHVCIERLQTCAPIPIVSVLDTIRNTVNSMGQAARVAVFGNRAVIRSNAYGAIDPSRVVPMSDETVESLHAIYDDVARNARHDSLPDRAELDSFAKRMMREGADTILLCGTDLSAFYWGHHPDYPFVDIAEAHITDILRYAGSAEAADGCTG